MVLILSFPEAPARFAYQAACYDLGDVHSKNMGVY